MLTDTIRHRLAGHARLCPVDPSIRRRLRDADGVLLPPGWRPGGRWTTNTVLKAWAAAFGQCVGLGNVAYKFGWMYVEFENVVDPLDEVVAPSFGRGADAGLPYYAALAPSLTRDYLRVPLVAAALDTTDEVDAPFGNQLGLFAETVGTLGVHGREFSASANSKVFGAAAVVGPVDGDPSADLVICRAYLAAAEQVVKPDNAPIGVRWKLDLL